MAAILLTTTICIKGSPPKKLSLKAPINEPVAAAELPTIATNCLRAAICWATPLLDGGATLAHKVEVAQPNRHSCTELLLRLNAH